MYGFIIEKGIQRNGNAQFVWIESKVSVSNAIQLTKPTSVVLVLFVSRL